VAKPTTRCGSIGFAAAFLLAGGPVRPWRSPTQVVHTPDARIIMIVQIRGRVGRERRQRNQRHPR